METSTRETSTRDLVQDLSRQTSTLIRQEMRLAQAELTEKGRHAGKGAGMFGGAGLAGWFTLLFLSLALTWLLDNWIDQSLAALIVAVLWGIAAAVLAMRGKKEIKEANPQLPTTQQTLKEDVQWAKTQKS
jgi:F0F1-type ATP synthase assembly protein I